MYTVEGGSWVHLVFFPVFPGAKRVSRRGSILSWLSPFGPALRQDIWDGKCPFFSPPLLLLFVSLSSPRRFSVFLFVIRARIRGGGELNSEMSRRGAKKKCRCNFFNLAALFCLAVCRAVRTADYNLALGRTPL